MADPDVFGPLYWTLLEATAERASDDASSRAARTALVDFVECWPDVLPCEECRTHFAVVLQREPGHSVRAGSMCPLRWAHALHAAVNHKVGSRSVSLDTVRKKRKVLRYPLENTFDLLAITATFVPTSANLDRFVRTVVICTEQLTPSHALQPLRLATPWTTPALLRQVDVSLNMLHGAAAAHAASAEARATKAGGTQWPLPPTSRLQSVASRAIQIEE